MSTTRTLGLALFASALLAACGGGGGGGGGGGTVTPPPPASTNRDVTVSGRVAFNRPGVATNGALQLGSPVVVAAQFVTVEILAATADTVLATTRTDANGNYTATVNLATNAGIRVRAKAQAVRTATANAAGFDLEVRDNRASNALYVLDSAVATPSGTTQTVDVTAATGWSTATNSYSGTRAAAPFAILDTLRQSADLIGTAQANVTVPALDAYWNPTNDTDTASVAECVFDAVAGDIGSTFYLSNDLPASTNCTAVPKGIYVLGDVADSDEFDASVMAHEFGHFYEDAFSRGDSMGGAHSLAGKHDLRLAYSEGWGNAFQSMVRNDRFYTDTFGNGNNSTFRFDIENDSAPFAGLATTGWYAEASVAEILYDLFDAEQDFVADTLNLGFGPIHAAMTQYVRVADTFASIYSLRAGLVLNRPNDPVFSSALDALLTDEQIFGAGELAIGESNSGEGANSPRTLPIFGALAFGQARGTISTRAFADPDEPERTDSQGYNRIGARRYFYFDMPAAGSVRVVATTVAANSDVDFAVWRRGERVCTGLSDSTTTLREEQVCNGLAAGRHVVEVYECANLGDLFCGPLPAGLPTDISINLTVTQQ